MHSQRGVVLVGVEKVECSGEAALIGLAEAVTEEAGDEPRCKDQGSVLLVSIHFGCLARICSISALVRSVSRPAR